MLPKSITTFIKGALILAPPLLIGLLIFRGGVDVPVMDEWDGTAPLFEKMADGSLRFGDFYAQHNEHRILFPRLIFFALGRLTHWDVRAEFWAIWLLTLTCLFNIWRIAHLRNSVSMFWLLFAASLLLFNPQNVANFLWGFQLGFLLPLACITASIWMAAYLSYPFNFLAAIILCTICTFSIGGGFTSWLLTTPILLFAQRQSNSPASKKWWVTWVILFCLELVAYFWGYKKPPYHPPIWWFLWHPIVAAEYILSFFGGPFSRGPNLPPVPVALSTGGLLLVMLLIAALYIWKKWSDRSLLCEVLPWLVLAMVSVTYAILIMIGRAGFGSDQARSARYLPFAVMLPIALLGLGPLIYSHWAHLASTRGLWVAKGSLALSILVLAFFTAMSFVGGLPFWPMYQQLGGYRKTLVAFINVLPETNGLAATVGRPSTVKTAVNVLNRIGYWRPPLIRSNLIGDIASEADASASGGFQFNEGEPGWINAGGSVFLPNQQRPADAILITCDNAAARGKPQICAITAVGSSYKMAGLRALWNASALRLTWNSRFPRGRLPKGQYFYLEAWAFNADKSRAYRLPGDAFLLQ
jgi:hypothetical protein